MNQIDPYLLEQWPLHHLGVLTAWASIDPNAPEVIVVVVDSGVDDKHEDIRRPSVDTVLDISRDDEDHGTLVAGTIGALTQNAIGVAGAGNPPAKPKIEIVSVKFSSAQYWPQPDIAAPAILKAVNYAPKDTRKRVIVLPWDVRYTTDELRDAIELAGSKDAVVIVAAGNEGLDNDKYPNWPANHGHMDHVITVMATDVPKDEKWSAYHGNVQDAITVDRRAWFSNFGKTTVHIAAPGVAVLSTAPYFGTAVLHHSIRVGYRYYRGTSAAAAYVAGLAALIRMKNPQWDARQVKNHLLVSAKPVDGLKGLCVTGGLADYERAICGPVRVISPAEGTKLRKDADAQITWRVLYCSPHCQTLKVSFYNDGTWVKDLASVLASNTSAQVRMPSIVTSTGKLRLSSEQGSFYAESDVFTVD